MNKSCKQAFVSHGCVACGCCESACPFQAIEVFRGMYAKADREKCVGCAKCKEACPAGAIEIENGGM